MYIKAYAKINIALNVLGKDDNGYHQLDMVNLPLELHDSIEISVLPDSSDSSSLVTILKLKKQNII
jgi:4-diphosphocytidyl-2C-methyl-D-erythritol kinase